MTKQTKVDQSRLWNERTLEQLLPYTLVFLEWEDGYYKYGEGSCLAYLGDYEIEFHHEYDQWAISRAKEKPRREHIVYQTNIDPNLEGLYEILVNHRVGKRELSTLWFNREYFKQVLLEKINGLVSKTT